MYSLEDILTSFAEETRIIKHLATKLPNGEAALEYKPNAYQRSMRELMYYLATMGLTMTTILKSGTYIPQDLKDVVEPIYARSLDEFDEMMNEQLAMVKDYLQGLTQTELDEMIDPFGQGAMSRKAMILNVHHKNFTAYRMQLFLYLKDAGASDLNTSNLRAGKDRE